MSALLILILIPLITAFACFSLPHPRRIAIVASGVNTLLSLLLFFFYDHGAGGFQFVTVFPVLPRLGLNFSLGADGLSLVVLLLATLITLCAVMSGKRPEHREGLYYGSILLISVGAIGAFCSIDIFFFYAFHELALIPTFLLIGIWGFGDRQAAAWKATVYLALGSFILLLGIIGLYLACPVEFRSFDMRAMVASAQAGVLRPSATVYLLLLFGFGILVSLFPFHTWAPAAYACAPAPASMLHAGVLKKFGIYGLLRIVAPIFPDMMQHFSVMLLILLAGNILYVGYVTVSQKQLDWTVGYSSVMHMGYLFLGFAGLNVISLTGAAVLLFAHGLSVSVLFSLVGEIRERTKTLHYHELGGLGQLLPGLGLLFGFATMASIGLPGFANFAGEIMVFFGAFASGGPTNGYLNAYQITTIVGVWGVVISAIYMLRAYRNVFFGEAIQKREELQDIGMMPRVVAIILILGLMIVGFYPQLLIHFISPALIWP